MRPPFLLIMYFCFSQFTFGQNHYNLSDFGIDIKFSPRQERHIEICNLKIGVDYEYTFNFNRGKEPFEVKLASGSQISKITSFTADATCKSFDFLVGSTVESNQMLRLNLREKNQSTTKKQMAFDVISSDDPSLIIKDIFQNNKCFEIIESSITYRGNLGTYENGSFLESPQGIIMSTGNVEYAEGPNDTSGNEETNGGEVSDPDLFEVSGELETFDVSTIEFDFIPTGGYIFFDYIFASEEYCDFVGSDFNDAFGFFLSGPGINGNFTNNAENLAVVNGVDPVSINTINWQTNSEQYVSNVPQVQFQDAFGCTFQERAALPIAQQEFQFDGFTKTLTAFAEVEPCEVYHLKMSIADVSDDGYDSAVFLKANSFFAGSDAEIAATANGSTDDLFVYENCGDQDLIITINRGPESVLEQDMPFGLEVSGTAISGEDYSFFDPIQEIPAFQQSVDIPITIISDDIPEGTETIEIQLSTACTCELPIIEIEIRELDSLTLALETDPVCEGSDVLINSFVVGGAAGYTYNWSNGFTESSIEFDPENQAFVGLEVEDSCGSIVADTIYFEILESPTAILTGEELVCDDNEISELEITIEGVGPFQIVVLNPTGALDTINTVERNLILPYATLGEYQLISIEDQCPGEVEGFASIVINDLEIELIGQDIQCYQDNDGKVELMIQGGMPPFDILWDDGTSELSIENLSVGTYQVIVNDSNGCSVQKSIEISEPIELEVVAFVQGVGNCLSPMAGSIELDVVGGMTPYTYAWSTGDSAASLSGLAEGQYTVTVTDQNSCSKIVDAIIPDDNSLPTVVAAPVSMLTCSTTLVEVNTAGSSDGPDFLYTWTNENGEVISAIDPSTLSVSEAGLYTLTITNLTNGCSGEQAVLVEENREVPQVNLIQPEDLNCINTVTTISPEEWNADYTYVWTAINSGNIISDPMAASIDVDFAGQYQVLVTNTISGCTALFQIEVVIDDEKPNVNVNDPFTIDCKEVEYFLTGNINLDVASAEIAWTTDNGNILSGANTLNPQISSGGDYVLTVTNVINGCVTSQNVTIDEDSEEPMFEFVQPDMLTCIRNEVIISIINFDENLDLDFSWTQNGQVLDNEISSSIIVSEAGAYSLLVTNNITGCTNVQTINIDQDIDSPSAEAGPDQTLDCLVDELTIEATASMGSNFVYAWSTINGVIKNGETTLTPTLSASGEYTLLVTNTVNGCTAQSKLMLTTNDEGPIVSGNQPELLTCTNQVSNIIADIATTLGNFSFSWTGPNNFFDDESLSIQVADPGQYILTAVDNDNGCESSYAVIVMQDLTIPQIVIGDPSSITCDTETIELTTTLIDPADSYTYIWSTVDGEILSDPSSANIEVTASGIYTVDLVDQATGCTNTQEILVLANLAVPDFLLTTENVIDCNNPISIITLSSEDDIQLLAEWQIPLSSNVELLQLNDDQYSVNQAGVYELVIINPENGCTATQQVQVQENFQAPLLESNIPVLINCLNNSSTLIVENVADMNLSYTWLDANQNTLTENNNQITVINAGQYSVLVTNLENGCTEEVDFFVEENLTQPIANIIGDNEINCEIQSVDLQATEVNDDHIYTWLDASGNILSNSSTVNIQEGGDYTLQVTNQVSLCASEANYTVFQSADLPQFDVPEPLLLDCNNTTTEIIANTTDPLLEFMLSTPNGDIVPLTSNVFEVDQPGTYTVSALNVETSCSRLIVVEVFQDIDPPAVDAGPGFELDCVETSYQLSGSTDLVSDFTFEWRTDSLASIVEGIETLSPTVSAGGIYSLLIIDQSNGCSAVDTVTVEQITDIPNEIFVSVQDPACAGDLGEIDIFEIDGGQGPYMYSIDDGVNYSDSNIFTELAPGEYDLRILDQNGCELDTRVDIPDTPEIFADLPEELTIAFGENAQLNTITNIDPSDIATITWSPTTQLSCTDCLDPQVLGLDNESYTLTIVNENGCIAEATIQLRVDRDIAVYIPNAFSPNNIDGINDVFMIFAKEGIVTNINTFEVFDRWGSKVFIQENFQPNDILHGWDGRHRGQEMNAGVFTYWAEILFIDGTTQLFKGDVTLLD